MDSDRWPRVEQLFHDALKQDPARRSAFIQEASAGDRALAREVEAMLACEASADSFLERPALELALVQDGMSASTLRRQLESALGGSDRAKPSPATEFRLASGTQLGPYLIEAPVSAGGMGEIYRARDTRLGRIVALKILASRLMGQTSVRERFEAEARAISRLNHPNICTLYDIGQERDIDYLVMEFLEGETLAERLKRGRLPDPEVAAIALQICDALSYSHANDVIHRDLKPGNIMLTARGAKLLDFGLARWEQEAEILSSVPYTAGDSSLTVTGLILGTPQYMAPEQIERRPADARTDIFALGAVLFEIASGQKAFAGQNPPQVMQAILSVDVPELRAVQPDVPPELAAIVHRCLRRLPAERWQSAEEISLALKQIINPRRRARQPKAIALSTAALLLFAICAGDRAAGTSHVPIRHDTVFRTLVAFPSYHNHPAQPLNLISGPKGVFYGATWNGGSPRWAGTVFQLDPPPEPDGAWHQTPLHTFTGGSDGANPAAVLLGRNGRLYGTTSWGGNSGNGTVFELTPPAQAGGAWTEKVLHHFTRVNGDGCNPSGALALGSNGEIYGTTQNGGTPGQGRGIAYELTPPKPGETTWTARVIHTFKDETDGTNPEGGLVRGADGVLYGTTTWGSGYDAVAYMLVPPKTPSGDWQQVVLRRLAYEEGHGRTGNLLSLGPNGVIYGTTQNTRGSVFALSPAATGQPWRETILHRFSGAFGDGAEVIGGVALGSRGELYGTTDLNATVFRLSPPVARGDRWVETILHSLTNGEDFPESSGSMILTDPHTLLGTASGGPLGGGQVFQLKF